MKREVYKIDATDKAPGRLASEVSLLLQGKNKPDWAPNVDSGGYVEVSNAKYIKITGNKKNQYKYHSYSGYPGGLKTKLMKELSEEQIIAHAVSKMLPRNRLKNSRIKRLKFV